MNDRPDNVLTEDEIRSAASAEPFKRAGSRTPPASPWAMWAPSVLGATILHVMAERDEARRRIPSERQALADRLHDTMIFVTGCKHPKGMPAECILIADRMLAYTEEE